MVIPSLRSLIVRFLLYRLRTARAVARLAYRLHADKRAIIDRRGTLTYGQLNDRVLRLNGWLEARGVRKGDIVFTWVPETGEQYEVRLATLENGSIFAPLHQHLSTETAIETLLRIRPKVFIHDPALSEPILQAVREQMPSLHMLALGAPYETALSSTTPLQGTAAVHEDDVFALHMTSGTTGLPKAVGYSHRKYMDGVRMLIKGINFKAASSGQDINMLGLPITGPGSGLVLPTLLSGAVLVMPENFRAATLARLITAHKVTRAFLSPSAIIDLLDDPELPNYQLGSLTNIPYGSEMMPAPKMAEALRHFGPIFQQSYGCLEALPPVTWLLPHEHVDASGAPVSLEILSSVGRVVAGVEVVIRDGEFLPLPQGVTGLITVRTPVGFDRYWNDPEKTREVFRDGWVVVGDIGYFDSAGYLHVLGRSADRVHKDGHMLNPREVEEVAHDHPAVKECCLVQHGEQTVLVVSVRQCWPVEHDISRLEVAIRTHVMKHLPPLAHPDSVRVVPAIPRSFLNKMLRREVRAMLNEEQPINELENAL